MFAKILLLILTLTVAAPVKLAAQSSYPSAPVKLYVGFAPGGANDILARIIAEKLTERFGKPFVVENRPGASGVLAVEAVKRSAPDGHSLLVGPSSAMSVNPVVLKKLSYDPIKDFVPIGMIGFIPLIVAVHPEFPAKSLKDLISLASAKPGTINYASAATSFQVATEKFAKDAGISLFHVPFRGSGPAANAVIGNTVHLIFGDVAAMSPLVKGGMVRALAVTSNQRLSNLPSVPTVAEAAVPGYEVVFWTALFAPAGTPQAIVSRLQKELATIVEHPDVRKRFEMLNVEPASPGAPVTPRIEKELTEFRAVVESAGITQQQ